MALFCSRLISPTEYVMLLLYCSVLHHILKHEHPSYKVEYQWL
jgi:hypothetical protein